MKGERSPGSDVQIAAEAVIQRIFVIRGRKVMLDKDLADLYQVATKDLNKAVNRNAERFPLDFMFQLTQGELENLRFQIGTSSWGGRRYLPYAFTEHGVAMLSSVLRSERAVQMNIFIIRAFVELREMLATNKDLAQKIERLERGQRSHGKHLVEIYSTLKKLMAEPAKKEGKMGFNADQAQV